MLKSGTPATGKAILEECISNHERTAALSYPQGFSISPWWEEKSKRAATLFRGFQTVEEAVEYAQRGESSGFDHRSRDAAHIVKYKFDEIQRCFAGFEFKSNPVLRESEFSVPGSIEQIGGIAYSNIFLTDVNYYLRCLSAFRDTDKPKRILEIGGGYGPLARIFKLMRPQTRYTIVDLPESLLFSQVFLRLNFPEARVHYSLSKPPDDMDSYDFVFVPVQNMPALAGATFDLTINTGSMQEMPDDAVKFWMNFVENTIRTTVFYSFNYFLNDKSRFPETSWEMANLICPVLDPYWHTRYFRINPEVITIDAASRNWLEVCLERIPQETRTRQTAAVAARNMFEGAQQHARGSSDWFAGVWQAIWKDPQPHYIEDMLLGIEAFEGGQGAINYLAERKSLLPWNMNDLKRYRHHIGNLFRRDAGRKRPVRQRGYGEAAFYKSLLARTKLGAVS